MDEHPADPCSDLLLEEDQDGLYTKRGRRQGSRDRASMAVVGVGEARNAYWLMGAFFDQGRSAPQLQAC